MGGAIAPTVPTSKLGVWTGRISSRPTLTSSTSSDLKWAENVLSAFNSSRPFAFAGHGAGPLDTVPGHGGRQAAVGVHVVRPGRWRADLPGRDDACRDRDLRADGQVRRAVAQGRHDRGLARGPRVPGEYTMCFYGFRFSTSSSPAVCQNPVKSRYVVSRDSVQARRPNKSRRIRRRRSFFLSQLQPSLSRKKHKTTKTDAIYCDYITLAFDMNPTTRHFRSTDVHQHDRKQRLQYRVRRFVPLLRNASKWYALCMVRVHVFSFETRLRSA